MSNMGITQENEGEKHLWLFVNALPLIWSLIAFNLIHALLHVYFWYEPMLLHMHSYRIIKEWYPRMQLHFYDRCKQIVRVLHKAAKWMLANCSSLGWYLAWILVRSNSQMSRIQIKATRSNLTRISSNIYFISNIYFTNLCMYTHS